MDPAHCISRSIFSSAWPCMRMPHFNCLTPPGVKNTILLLYLCLIKYSSVNFSCSSCNAYMGWGAGAGYRENSGGLALALRSHSRSLYVNAWPNCPPLGPKFVQMDFFLTDIQYLSDLHLEVHRTIHNKFAKNQVHFQRQTTLPCFNSFTYSILKIKY